MVRRVLLEVAVETPDDVFAADQGGADRLELCAALDLGGLTPSLGTLQEARSFSKLPICVMIRPRPGDFVYTPAEVSIMRRDIELFFPFSPAGFVFGVLQADGSVNLDACLKLVNAAQGVPCVFHRAFDRTPDLLEAMNEIVGLGFRRILSSGQGNTALQGLDVLSKLVRQAEGKIELLACGKIRPDNVLDVIRGSNCSQVHGSFATEIPDRHGLGYRGYGSRCQTDEASVRATRQLLDRPWDYLTS